MGRNDLSAHAAYARRGYHYIREYGMRRLYRKAREHIGRNALERGYQSWMLSRRLTEREKELQREHVFQRAPLISVVVPVYRTPEAFLREMVESVLHQTYSNLELCLADGSGDDDSAERILTGYAERDARVRYQKLPHNLGIAGNTNAAVAMASGDYVALLDHDDFLEEHALFEIARWLEAHPDTELLYTDEDKVTFDSQTFFQPHFKPDFNEDLLRSNNYICHFLVVSRRLARETGAYREEFDGAQDYDFILRASERAKEIGHIPQILYHWRCHTASTAANPESKAYAYEAGRRAVESHLERTGEEATVESMDNPGFYRVSYRVSGRPRVSIVLLELSSLAVLRRFVRAMGRHRTYADFEILALWSGPEKNKLILNFIKEHRQIPIKVVYCISARNNFVTFSRLAEKLDSDYLLFMDARTERVSRGFLETFLGNAQRPGTGAVGGRVYDSGGRLVAGAKVLGLAGQAGDAFAGLRFGYSGYFHKAVLQQNFHAVSGKAMMVSRKDFLEAGGFSEDVEDRFKDVDLCLKLEGLGRRNRYDPGIVLVTGGESARRRRTVKAAPAFEKKWKDALQTPDRFYNCNLSLESSDYRIRQIP
ncbi:MAG: glycosyltransferase [Eubacteriales bacterium]|nr:glycosyltransferase [Eubacteriales bacterium]